MSSAQRISGEHLAIVLGVLISAAPFLIASGPALADSQNLFGTTGTAGTDGGNANPGEDGGNGTNGGDAVVDVSGNTDASNSAGAFGGAGGRGGDGGDAVSGNFDGGDGGNGGNGGAGNANAETTVSSGAASATANAQGGSGGRAGFGGNPSGTGMRGDDGAAGAGGDATASGAVTNSGGGNSNLSATATGGTGGSASDGGTAGNGGSPTLGSVVGTSTGGGTVNVTGIANGGDGGLATGTGTAGSGAAVSLTDEIDGSTSGSLSLRQLATGGNSGAVQEGLNGTAGSASSTLSKDVSADATKPSTLTVDAGAFGGSGGSRNAGSGPAADGATGTASASAINNGGTARAFTDARGGAGGSGSNGADGGDGADAMSTAFAQTSGDGNSIDVDGFANTFGSGGDGGAVFGGSSSDGGDGGDATSTSTGIAMGDSLVDVDDRADGGTGGNVNSGTGSGGAGGDASSSGSASNVGSVQSVFSNASAFGGAGGTARGIGEVSGDGGDATAVTTATGGAFVSSVANATGGNTGTAADGATNGLGGNAFATATGTGTTGSASAGASTGGSTSNLVSDVTTGATAPIASTSAAESRAQLSGAGFSVNDALGRQSASFGYGAPSDAVTLPNIVENAVLANFDVSGTTNGTTIFNSPSLNSDIFGMGVMAGQYSQDGSETILRSYTSSADYNIELSQLQNPQQDLLIGFMNPVVSGTGFDEATLVIRRENTIVVNTTFNTTQDALNFLDSQTINLGPVGTGVSGPLDVDIDFTVRSDTIGEGLAFDYVLGNSTITPRAVSSTPVKDVDVGVYRVGVGDGTDTLTAVEIQNVAVSGSDNLDADFVGTTGNAITNGGPVSGLAPGASNSDLEVGLNTASAGNVNATATIEFTTDGATTTNTEALGQQIINITGVGFNTATGALDPTTVDLGNYRINTGALGPVNVEAENTAPVGSFTEGLKLAVDASGTTGIDVQNNAGDSSSLIVAGTPLANALVISSDGMQAGTIGGTVNVDFVSDGTNTSGLSDLTTGSETVEVTGTGYRLAEFAPLGDVDFGNILVGSGPQMRTVQISNTALADMFSEDLNATIGSVTDTGAGVLGASGSVSGLLAGAMDMSSIVVTVDPTEAGNITGTVTIDFESAGAVNGVSNGLGTFALGSDELAVLGIIGQAGTLALPSQATPDPIVGAVRVGDAFSRTLTIENQATTPAEGLNAFFTGTSDAAIIATGTVGTPGGSPGLAPGATDSSSLQVAVDTTAAGAGQLIGTATLQRESDGTFNSNMVTDLGVQDVDVDVKIFNPAEGATVPTTLNFAAKRVGDAVESQALSIQNTGPDTGGFTEDLRADVGGSPLNYQVNGSDAPTSVSGIAQGTSGDVMVSLLTDTAGDFTGESLGIDFVSTAIMGSGLADLDVGGTSVTLNGKVYTPADAAVEAGTTIDFGTQRIGTSVADMTRGVSNDAEVTALNDVLTGGFSPVGIPFGTDAGDLLGGVAAGDGTTVAFSLDTSVAGSFNASTTLGLQSSNPDMADLDVGSVEYQLSAIINALANPVIELDSGDGSLDVDGPLFTLDFGNIALGSTDEQLANLMLLNDVLGPAENLGGMFLDPNDPSGAFMFSGFDQDIDLTPQMALEGLMVAFDPNGLTTGVYEAEILLNPLSMFPGFMDLPLQDITLAVRARIFDDVQGVPEPGTLLLLLAGIALLVYRSAPWRARC